MKSVGITQTLDSVVVELAQQRNQTEILIVKNAYPKPILRKELIKIHASVIVPLILEAIRFIGTANPAIKIVTHVKMKQNQAV